MQGTGDLDLVRKIKAGDREAFGELVDRHQKAVYRLAVRFVGDYGVAEDIVQESFFKAFQKINLFEERSSFKSWLFRIAINTCKNRWRAKSYHDVNLNDIVVSVGERTTKQLEHDEIQEFLHQEVEKLPHKQKTALKLRVFEDLSFQDIAQIMSCPYDTAKANYRHAVLKLKAAFEPADGSMSRLGWILEKDDGIDVQFLQSQRGE